MFQVQDGKVVSMPVPALACDHEEADTRLLLHANHAAHSGYQAIVVDSPDTDVAVLMCHHASALSSALFFRTGTKNKFQLRQLAEPLAVRFVWLCPDCTP